MFPDGWRQDRKQVRSDVPVMRYLTPPTPPCTTLSRSTSVAGSMYSGGVASARVWAALVLGRNVCLTQCG
jgi:hypothetical protein